MSIAEKSVFKEYDDEDFDPCISDEERQFYIKAYPKLELVCERKVHCTICKTHIGTAPAQELNIKMHPVLRVTQCQKCHDFYNSGEFSKGEDGSELYCRWCGQGGEVYCCSSCPYVFCKHCIVNNLSRGVVNDIENNENWNCFSCTSKILWPLRAQHWALVKYIDKQKKEVQAINYTETEYKQAISKDNSTCCRTKKIKNESCRKSDSVDSMDSINSKRSGNSVTKRHLKCSPATAVQPKRSKVSNDEVVCTPDLSSMLEPVCQITVPQVPLVSNNRQGSNLQPGSTSPECTITQNCARAVSPINDPPPLVLRNTSVQLRPATGIALRRSVNAAPAVSPGATSPVYHTINGFRVDLNSASQQETFRLPNGKLIQVKRQSAKQTNFQNQNEPMQQQLPLPSRTVTRMTSPANHLSIPVTSNNQHFQQQQSTPHPTRPFQIMRAQGNSQSGSLHSHGSNGQLPSTLVPPQNIYHLQHNPQPTAMSQQQQYRFTNSTSVNIQNNLVGQPIQVVNGAPIAPVQSAQSIASRPVLVKHLFPETAIGQARSQLQDEVFNTMEVTQHLSNKLVSFTNSNAYKQARNYLDVKELYIHLSYVLSYVIARYKGLQEQCLSDMRQLGFVVDADNLENGQLAAEKRYPNSSDDNDIEIVEPQTDTIDLDSDSEDQPLEPNTNLKIVSVVSAATGETLSNPQDYQNLPIFCIVPNSGSAHESTVPVTSSITNNEGQFLKDTILISKKKQPRRKTTNKPNPTLIKQRELLEKERLQGIRPRDQKLKMRCSVRLRRAEREYPYVNELLQNFGNKGHSDDSIEKSKQKENKNKFKSYGLARVKVVLKKIDQKIVDKVIADGRLCEDNCILKNQKSNLGNKHIDERVDTKDNDINIATKEDTMNRSDKELSPLNETLPTAVDLPKDTSRKVEYVEKSITNNVKRTNINDNLLSTNSQKISPNDEVLTCGNVIIDSSSSEGQNIEENNIDYISKPPVVTILNAEVEDSALDIVHNQENNDIGLLESISVECASVESKDDNVSNEIDPLAVELIDVENQIDAIEIQTNMENESEGNTYQSIPVLTENGNLNANSKERIDSK